MRIKHTGNPGTVISGTLRSEDLLSCFASELEHLIERNGAAWDHTAADLSKCEEYQHLIGEARNVAKLLRGEVVPGQVVPDDVDEHASGLVDELFGALDDFAPAWHYFGAHEGDGADFGFWPNDPGDREDDNREPDPGY